MELGKAVDSIRSAIDYVTGVEINAIDLLKKQHEEVKELFSQLEDLGERAHKAKESIFLTLADKLTLHTKLEEKFFYPRIKTSEKTLTLEAYEEHDAVKTLIQKIKTVGAEDESFDAKVKFLKELVMHHVDEEENDLLPRWRQEESSQTLERIGRQMQTIVDATTGANEPRVVANGSSFVKKRSISKKAKKSSGSTAKRSSRSTKHSPVHH